MGLGSAHLSFIITIDLLQLADALALLSRFAFDDLVYSPEVMARCSPLSKVTTANAVEVKNVDKVVDVAEILRMVSEKPVASNGEGHVSRPDAADDSLGEGASDDENSRTYYFGSLTITAGKIKEMVEKGYFVEGEAHTSGAKMVPEPDSDEAIVYEDFICCSLTHASTSCFGRHFSQVSSTATSVDTQHYSTTLQIFLGRWQLRGRARG
jgi:hypothetical protein